MFKRTERGQSIGEYAVLLAIILGAVVGVQALVRNRVAGAIQSQADTYVSKAKGTESADSSLLSKKTSNSTSTARSTMTSSRAGDVQTGSSARQGSDNPQ